MIKKKKREKVGNLSPLKWLLNQLLTLKIKRIKHLFWLFIGHYQISGTSR